MLKINFDSTDISREQSRFEYIVSTLELNQELLIGFYKPISSLFINLTTSQTENVLSVKYYNGSSFLDVSGLLDLTFGLTKSAFVSWNKNQTLEAKTTLEGESLYWYKLELEDTATVNFKGIAPLFSDDFDLASEFPTIANHLPEDAESFVRFHESARKAIINDLRNAGFKVKPFDSSKNKQLDEYDILDKEEVRECSKFLTLSKIFFWLSDSAQDKWNQLADKYAAEAAGALTPLMSIDQDDNGKETDEEVADTHPILIGRL